MRYLSAILLIATLALFVTACSGGGGVDDPPAQSDISAVMHINTIRVYAGPGSADPGTEVSASTGVNDKTVTADDGSIKFDIVGAVFPQSQPYKVTLSYTKDGTAMVQIITVAQLFRSVTTPLFSTGSAPNDILFGNDSLYVANSMDNTVVRYGVDGGELATANFSPNSSPSYLGLSSHGLWVATNGIPTLSCYDQSDLSSLDEVFLLGEALETIPAFIGPGSPACFATVAMVPCSMIHYFGDTTTYEDAVLISCDTNISTASNEIALTLSGRNGQSAAWSPSGNEVYIVSAGEIQFDEFWTPYATSDSYLDIYDVVDSAINLGQIGASRIAIDPAGEVAYLGNLLTGNLYSVDLVEQTIIHGADNPIVLTDEFTYISDVAFTPDGKYVLATSFNTDELYVIDAATGEVNPGPYPAPFDLALDPELMAGCLGVEVDPTPDAVTGRYTAYVLYGIANAVAEVQLF